MTIETVMAMASDALTTGGGAAGVALAPAAWAGLLALAVGCGALTTLTGQGGGMLLLLGLTAALGPLPALQLSAPALLVGNAHRLWALRQALERGLVGGLALGAALGSVAGGLLATRVPRGALLVVMVAMVALGLGRRFGMPLPLPPRWALGLWTFGTGLLCAVGGGAGMLVAPLLMALGLSGAPYVATAAAVAVAMHVGRVVGYGAGGGMGPAVWAAALPLAAALVAGNGLGLLGRARVGSGALRQLEQGSLLAVAAVAVVRWWWVG